MSDAAFTALRAAITTARNREIKSLSDLRRALIAAGHAPEDVDEAFTLWKRYGA